MNAIGSICLVGAHLYSIAPTAFMKLFPSLASLSRGRCTLSAVNSTCSKEADSHFISILTFREARAFFRHPTKLSLEESPGKRKGAALPPRKTFDEVSMWKAPVVIHFSVKVLSTVMFTWQKMKVLVEEERVVLMPLDQIGGKKRL